MVLQTSDQVSKVRRLIAARIRDRRVDVGDGAVHVLAELDHRLRQAQNVLARRKEVIVKVLGTLVRVAIVLDTDKLGELELAAKVSVPVSLGANANLALQGLDRRRNLRRNTLVLRSHR